MAEARRNELLDLKIWGEISNESPEKREKTETCMPGKKSIDEDEGNTHTAYMGGKGGDGTNQLPNN